MPKYQVSTDGQYITEAGKVGNMNTDYFECVPAFDKSLWGKEVAEDGFTWHYRLMSFPMNQWLNYSKSFCDAFPCPSEYKRKIAIPLEKEKIDTPVKGIEETQEQLWKDALHTGLEGIGVEYGSTDGEDYDRLEIALDAIRKFYNLTRK